MYLLIKDIKKVRIWISVPQKEWIFFYIYILDYLQGICVHLQFDAATCNWKADFKGFPSDPLLVLLLRLLCDTYFNCLLPDSNEKF